MQFFIALGILLLASTAYLLHQFWSRTLSSGDAPRAEPIVEEPQSDRLKAA